MKPQGQDAPLLPKPRHVAIIMDGNGRWAKERGLPRIEGHREGAQSVRALLRAAKQAGIEYLTVYAFSTENWKRPPHEVAALMQLLVDSLDAYEQELHDNQIRLRVMGRIDDLPGFVRKRVEKAVRETAHYPDHTFIVALSYGGRAELVDATRKIAQEVQSGQLNPAKIDEETIAQHLYLPDVPDPDLLIRTSGELRLSNFLLWQLSYAEFYITQTYWPDFREADFQEALKSYQQRDRRIGGVKERPDHG